MMLTHYVATALRHFRRHRLTTAINVACLALGLACFVLAWGTVEYFDRMDGHHARAGRIVFLTSQSVQGDSSAALTLTTTPWVLADRLAAAFPELESVVRVFAPPARDRLAVSVDGAGSFVSAAYAEPALLRTFDLPLLSGDSVHALDKPHSAIVSRALAQRLFGSDDVLGRTLQLGELQTVTVTGVVDSIRQPSHLTVEDSSIAVHFEALMSMDVWLGQFRSTAGGQAPEGWRSNWFFTYAVLPQDGSLPLHRFNERLAEFARLNIPAAEGSRRIGALPVSRYWEASLNMIAGTDRTGISSTQLVRSLGMLVLFVACLNYANLAAALAMTQAREVAVQRIIGAHRRQLLLQSLCEGVLLSTAALLMAAACTAIALWSISDFMAGFTLMLVLEPATWIGAALLILLVSIVAGAYPALIASSIRPGEALRRASVRAGPQFVATLFVLLQFASASLLLTVVLVMSRQQSELKQSVLAQTHQPLVILTNAANAGVDPELLRAALRGQPGILAVSGINRAPWTLGSTGVDVGVQDDPAARPFRASLNIVGHDFFPTLGIPMLAGRAFSADRGTDVADMSAWKKLEGASEFAAIIDLSFAQRLGFADANAAVGKTLYRPTMPGASRASQHLRIVGVAADSTHVPMNGSAKGNVYLLNPRAAAIPMVRMATGSIDTALAGVDAFWHARVATIPLERRFADEQFDLSFRFLDAIQRAFAILALFAALIAAMGLVGMALHVTRRRRHEIGVRKTLGASTRQILIMLLKNFSMPVILANVLMWPLAYAIMSIYLGLFSRAAGLSAGPFIVSLLAMVIVAWTAVIAQAWRAAKLQPATVLRYE